MRVRYGVFFWVLVAALAAIGVTPAAAQDDAPTVTEGDQLLHETFRSSGAWEKYTTTDGVDFSVGGGVYGMFIPKELPHAFVWAVNSDTHDDVIIEATFIQRTENPDAQFGLMCRTNVDGDGYYFVIGGDGSAFIARGDPDAVVHIADATETDAILTGTDANLIRAICAGDYLAMYVNDELVVDTTDDTFTDGVAGLTAFSGEDVDTDVTVDDLDIYQAVIDDSSDNVEVPEIEGVDVGKVLLAEPFDDEDAWGSYQSSRNSSNLRVEDGVYLAEVTEENLYFRGENSTVNDNYVISVEATFEDGPDNNAYGVMCRSTEDNNGNGYYFVISADGYYTIFRFDEGEDEAVSLVEWTESDVINQGNVTNTITVACVDDLLALYINGTKVAETHDDTYSEGFTGLTAIAFDAGTLEISFDNLNLFNAKTA